MATTSMTYRGVEYEVSGGWDSESGSYAGPDAVSVIVRRADGRAIRGAQMHAGMVQTGLSRQLSDRAEKAIREVLEAERAK